MSYDKKIAIIESNISELEEDLNVVNIRLAEKIETSIEIINDVVDDVNSIDEKMNKENIEKYERKLELIREKMNLPYHHHPDILFLT